MAISGGVTWSGNRFSAEALAAIAHPTSHCTARPPVDRGTDRARCARVKGGIAMGKHIESREHPLKAPPHSGCSPATAERRTHGANGRQETGAETACAIPSSRQHTLPEEITDELIALRAYELWLEKGRPEGRDVDNWIEAEWQLHQQRSAPQESTTPLIAEP
jgi:hypothetical protein